MDEPKYPALTLEFRLADMARRLNQMTSTVDKRDLAKARVLLGLAEAVEKELDKLEEEFEHEH